MNHLFVPQKESLELKEIGFNEPCLAKYAIYNPKDPVALFPQSQDFFKGYFNFCKNSDYTDKIAAPLYQQAFDWFREKHGYIHTICRVYNWSKEIPEYEGFCVYIGSKDPKVKLKCNDHFISNFYQDYREAELVVLKTLIEIVKNDNTTRS